MDEKAGTKTRQANGRSHKQGDNFGGRSMPESLAAEAAVLGSMIVDPVCIGDCVEQLRAEAFYRLEHQIIYDALIRLYEKNKGDGIDGVLLRDELERCGKLEQIGGVEYLANIMNSVPSAANVGYYTGIVKDKHLLRELIAVSSEILEEAYDGSGDTSGKLDDAERRIFAVTNKKITGSASSLKDLVMQTYELIEGRDGKHVTGLETGFFKLDEMTCGLQKGEMLIVAGRPSMGKTAFALNIAEHVSVVNQIPCAIFSMEMGKQQLAERFLCSRSQVDSDLVRKGILSTEHYQRLVEACGELSQAPVYIDDSSAVTPLELRAKARRLKSQYDIQCIFLDYLQLMSGSNKRSESRQQEITEISRYLKALARELDIPVVVLSQLNRAAEGREDHRPRMSDLRESGSIEQDADVIMLLHREAYYQRKKDFDQDQEADPMDDFEDNTAEVIIAKQRNGPTGTVKLIFRDKLTRFENASFVEGPF